MKKHAKIITISILILVLSLFIWLYFFAFSLKASSKVNNDLMSFEGDYDSAIGFVDANTLKNRNKLVGQKGDNQLYLDETTSHFYIKNLSTGEIIRSNPYVEDHKEVKTTIQRRQQSTIEYMYFNKNGSISSKYNNYDKSIYHEKTYELDEGQRTFKIKEIENGFQVFYKITTLEIDYLYFPLYLTPEEFEPIYERDRSDTTRRAIVNAYSEIKDPATGLYKAKNYESMSGNYKAALFTVFYEKKEFGEYSRERAIAENAKHGYFEQEVRFGFEVAVQVILEDDGVEVKVINNSIKEESESKLSEITLYPYFGTAIDIDPISQTETEGYMVIPDGSGAILNFNNGRNNVKSYSKRFYGRDMAYLPFEMSEEQEKISIPVFGMIKEKIGYSAIITEGDTQAILNASISDPNNDKYNRIFVTYKMRENELAVLGSGWNTHQLNLWTKDLISTDITVKYKILTAENNNYNGVAKSYQNYLIKNHGLELDYSRDKKTTLEFLGAYDNRAMFLGIPYNAMSSLTNYDEAYKIIDELGELGVKDINLIYSGITNGGLNNNFETKVNFEKKVGSKRKFKKFEKEMNELGIDIYPTANFFSTNNFNKVFDENKYSSSRIKGERSKIFNYNIPTRLPYSETAYDLNEKDHVVINPRFYESIYNKYDKSYSFDSLLLDGIGTSMAGNYKKKDVVYLNESIKYQENIFKSISENKKVAVSSPLGFSYAYLDLAVDLPIESTLYSVLDYKIPLLQLVLSGLVDHTHESINLASKRDLDYKFLKALENGSSLKYTLSYKSSLELLGTNHNQYMSTEYTNWLDLIQEHNDVYKNNGLNNSSIINHEIMQNNVFKTTYSNGVYIITNYNLTNIEVDGVIIDSIGYYIGGTK